MRKEVGVSVSAKSGDISLRNEIPYWNMIDLGKLPQPFNNTGDSVGISESDSTRLFKNKFMFVKFPIVCLRVENYCVTRGRFWH